MLVFDLLRVVLDKIAQLALLTRSEHLELDSTPFRCGCLWVWSVLDFNIRHGLTAEIFYGKGIVRGTDCHFNDVSGLLMAIVISER